MADVDGTRARDLARALATASRSDSDAVELVKLIDEVAAADDQAFVGAVIVTLAAMVGAAHTLHGRTVLNQLGIDSPTDEQLRRAAEACMSAQFVCIARREVAT